MSFTVCALVVAGLPPLSGFVAKLAMLEPLLDVGSRAGPWTLFALLIGSGLLAAMALMRVGIRHFWTGDRAPPRLRVAVALPIAALLLLLLTGLAIDGERLLHATHPRRRGRCTSRRATSTRRDGARPRNP